jgi:solute carrier family 25 S-adenosylmethionine transporter 26
LPLPGIPGFRRNSSSASASSTTRISAGGSAASLTLSSTDASLAGTASLAATTAKPKLQLKPASDVLAGALARALSQSTIHPLDTLKVRMQARPPPSAAAAAAAAASSAATVKGLSKFGQLVPPAGAASAGPNFQAMTAGVASLYKGVFGAASGAGIAIGAYFACYGLASNMLAAHSDLSPSAAAFVAGGVAAAGSSVVKVPLAVCIRSVQAGVYPNVFAAASSITSKAGPRGLFTGGP